MAKPQLRTRAEPAPVTLPILLRQIIANETEREHMARPELLVLQLEPALRLQAQKAKCTRERFDELDAELRGLADADDAVLLRQYVGEVRDYVLRERALPDSGWTYIESLPQFNAACQEYRTTSRELRGVALLRVGTEKPELFAEGCADASKHEQHIAAINKRRDELEREHTELLVQAACILTWGDDYVIDVKAPGIADIWYAIGGRYSVRARAPGDVRGVAELVTWLRRHPEVAATLGDGIHN